MWPHAEQQRAGVGVGAHHWSDGPFRYAADKGNARTDLVLPVLETLRRRARRTGRHVVLVTDNGSVQTSRRSDAAQWQAFPVVVMFWPPAYSSEQLNDIENLRHHLKDDYLSEILVTLREDFMVAVCRLLNRLRRTGELRRMLKPKTGGGKKL